VGVDLVASPFIDQMAAGGGIGSLCRPLVMGGDPAAILGYTGQVTDRIRTFVSLLGDLERARDQLRQLWTGSGASDAAMRELAQAFDTFHRTIQVLTRFVQQLEAAAGTLDLAQRGHNAAVRAAEPTVAALSGSPWTRPAATALATGVTSSLAAFLNTAGSLLTAIGQQNIAGIVSSLSSVTGTNRVHSG
jgi:uncharacterized protein YukE